MIKVLCTLKSGGPYDQEYVYKLERGVKRGFNFYVFCFLCYTDLEIPNIDCVRLQSNLKGWWAKTECFNEHGPAIYLDLDTVVLDRLDSLVDLIIDDPLSFFMLEAFNSKRTYASGIMGWYGDWRWLYKAAATKSKRFYMDQDAIVEALEDRGAPIGLIRRERFGIYSYKHHCSNGLPKDASVICFHGRPRPHEVNEGWLQ